MPPSAESSSAPPTAVGTAWWALLGLGLLLSLTGDRLRSLLLAGIGPGGMEAGLWLLLGGLAVAALGWYPKASVRLDRRGLPWLLPALVVVLGAGQEPTDPAHLVLFGAFGFLSGLRFGVWRGLAVAAAAAAVDELVQIPLAHRIADWWDVGLDLGAALVGAGLAGARLAAVRTAMAVSKG